MIQQLQHQGSNAPHHHVLSFVDSKTCNALQIFVSAQCKTKGRKI